ncbi:MAG: polyribonucleotide nucleotidyltransferase [Deltaproteobacteria bacterium]|nr:polyribonucleotide nucleotidyltransferase [Deltaproteobacteria bacterium]
MYKKIEMEFYGRPLSIETGRMAKQASGAAIVTYGETVVLVTATATEVARVGIDFFPLTVDYQERTFAAGKIPGGFFKREGRPSEREILTSRLVDRALRPLFPEGFYCETQVVASVLSVDRENDADTLAMIGASAALQVSDIPFGGPIAGVRIGRLRGVMTVNPLQSQLDESDINLFVAAGRNMIIMVEGGAQAVSEEDMLEALFLAQESVKPILDVQDEIARVVGKPKRTVVPVPRDTVLIERVRGLVAGKLEAGLLVTGKFERRTAVANVKQAVKAALAEEYAGREREIDGILEEQEGEALRMLVVREHRRVDGRGLSDIRPITCEVGVLPRTHGSALFTRGETQALVIATLGTAADEQRVDALVGEQFKKFMLHYNFPAFSVGEVRPLRGPGRREIGHGALAERALQAMMPDGADFPYTVRIVSEVLESNGSSSMATVCGGTMSLMDAGVPIKAPVAGIAMGLIKEGEAVRVLSDILGDEDHLGDMDFKVAGTAQGITALQMDIKIAGVTKEVMQQALYQARDGRLFILEQMMKVLEVAREDVSGYAPRITTMKVKPEKIRDLIGPGGKMIRSIIEETGVKIDVEDDGTVVIASADGEAMSKAIARINRITAEAEIGKIYKGTVRKVMDFGAFVEILPGTDGLVHISQLGTGGRVRRVEDVVEEGDEIMVKVLEIDRQGKIRLSHREALQETQGAGSGTN